MKKKLPEMVYSSGIISKFALTVEPNEKLAFAIEIGRVLWQSRQRQFASRSEYLNRQLKYSVGRTVKNVHLRQRF